MLSSIKSFYDASCVVIPQDVLSWTRCSWRLFVLLFVHTCVQDSYRRRTRRSPSESLSDSEERRSKERKRRQKKRRRRHRSESVSEHADERPPPDLVQEMEEWASRDVSQELLIFQQDFTFICRTCTCSSYLFHTCSSYFVSQALKSDWKCCMNSVETAAAPSKK